MKSKNCADKHAVQNVLHAGYSKDSNKNCMMDSREKGGRGHG